MITPSLPVRGRVNDDDDRAAGAGCAFSMLPSLPLLGLVRDNPWPDDVDLSCSQAGRGALLATLIEMWRHRRELPALWRELGGAR